MASGLGVCSPMCAILGVAVVHQGIHGVASPKKMRAVISHGGGPSMGLSTMISRLG